MIYFRCDASTKIGAGHVVRCKALAEAILQIGHKVTFICAKLSESLKTQIENLGIFVRLLKTSIGSRNDLEQTLKIIENISTKSLIVDGYNFNYEYLTALREKVQLIVVDDNADRPLNADVILNPNVHGTKLTYLAGQTKVLTGPEYALLRPQFLAARNRQKKITNSIHRILISFGGSDPTGQSERVLRALSHWNGHVDVVTGLTNTSNLITNETQSTFKGILQFHKNVKNMAALMIKADLAICAAGGTTWELASLGIPMMQIAIAENQLKIALRARDIGISHYLGWYEDVSLETITKYFFDLDCDIATRQKMRQNSLNLIDAQGCNRVASILFSN